MHMYLVNNTEMRLYYVLNVNIHLIYTVFRVYMNIKNSEEAYGLSQSIKHPYGNNIVMVLKCYDNSFIGFINQLNCHTYFNTF